MLSLVLRYLQRVFRCVGHVERDGQFVVRFVDVLRIGRRIIVRHPAQS